MDDQEINIVTPKSETPPEVTVHRDRRTMKLGARAAEILERFAEGEPLVEEEKAKLAALDDPALVREFVDAKLGSGFDLTRVKAQAVFSKILFSKISLPEICMTRMVANIGETEMMKAHAFKALERHEKALQNRDDGKVFHEEDIMDQDTHLAYSKLALLSTTETAKMLDRAQKMALAAGNITAAPAKKKRQLADFSQTTTNINVGVKVDSKPSEPGK
jgi:hypothetical protein